jgi:hypothetical protein
MASDSQSHAPERIFYRFKIDRFGYMSDMRFKFIKLSQLINSILA